MPEATFGTLACRIIARHAAGSPNIMIGKKPEEVAGGGVSGEVAGDLTVHRTVRPLVGP